MSKLYPVTLAPGITSAKTLRHHQKDQNNWRASVASETLTGVTQAKIGDV